MLRHVGEQNMDGVSVIICCHNSSGRIERVLRHLRTQDASALVPWEVVLVDNASDDETAAIVRREWGTEAPAELRVVREPRRGLSYARTAGLRRATYPLASFVDDDNLVAPDWVRSVSRLMAAHPDAGVIGSHNVPRLQGPAPDWFDRYSESFGVGTQAEGSSDITWTRGYVWGAGLSLRRSAWLHLVDEGFAPINVGRSGKTLTAGDDSELCYALRLAGWRIRYEPELRLEHEIPPARLRWEYLLSLHRGFGHASVGHDPYTLAAGGDGGGLGNSWLSQAAWAAGQYLKRGPHVLERVRRRHEGSAEALRAEWLIGRIRQLVRVHSGYDRTIRRVADARWVRIEAVQAAQP